MRIIDGHAHLLNESGYLDQLLQAMDRCGIEKACLSGLGPLFDSAGDREVLAAVRAHPDRIIGSVFVRPGVDGPEKIDNARNDGFLMVKVSIPRLPYDDPRCFPLWERALEHRMPVLYHTGIVDPSTQGRGEGISSWFMHPMRVEPITREFPDLPVILAHLGINWNMDAAELARMRPNVYVDLTGAAGGWRTRADAVGMDRWLWWPGAFDKVIFGTDVHCSRIGQVLKEDRARLDRLDIAQETRRSIFSGNILRLLARES